jgi:metallo-beta-lactamase family protein
VTLKDAGHILGSSMVEFVHGDTKILFTGDLGNSPAPLLKDTETITDATYLIMESVYGDRDHEARDDRRRALENAIEETVKRAGALVVPAFSLERTQELLYEIKLMTEQSRIPLIQVFLDSPLAIKLTKLYEKYEDYFNNRVDAAVPSGKPARTTGVIQSGRDIFKFPGLRATLTTDESKSINEVRNPKIIIAGSGMSNGGRIIHHEKRYLPDPKSTVLLVGYQVPGSLGRELQDGAKTVRILGEEIPVRASIRMIQGYSAHKDMTNLIGFVRETADTLKRVFVVMGEPKSALFLTQRLRDYLGVNAHAPEPGETVELEI